MISVLPLEGIPEIEEGDDLAGLLSLVQLGADQ